MFRSSLSAHAPALRRPQRPFAPVLERLEDRTVPAIAALFTPPPTVVHTAPVVSPTPVVNAVRAAIATPTATTILRLNLPPINLNVLGLQVKTDRITVTVRALPGQGRLLGNLLTDVSGLLNLSGVNTALNKVLGNVVNLLNQSRLNLKGVDTSSGPLSSSTQTKSVVVLDAFVAPIHLNLLGALVDTSAIRVRIIAHPGPGKLLGNLVADLANLFNPPLPSTLNINTINQKLEGLLKQLNQQFPGIAAAPTTAPSTTTGTTNILRLTVPPINLNLLGLVLKTSQIRVNVDAIAGNGNLLGNILTSLVHTLGATPANLATLNNDLNAILAKVVGVLNKASLTLPTNATSTLSDVLQQLALPNLLNLNGPTTPTTIPILNLVVAASNNVPVRVNLLGLRITTSNIQVQLLARTGQGQILGNLLFNIANLLNPGGSLNLLGILGTLGL